MKNIVLFLIILINFVFLVSCSSKNNDYTEVTFSSWGSKSEIAEIKSVIKDFESQNPKIKIKLIHIPDNYFQKLHLLVASNLSPDVIFLNNLNALVYIDSNKLEPLDGFLSNSKIIKSDDFYTNALYSISKKENIYAIPRDISNMAIYYNKDLFDKYKVQYPKAYWTMNDFLEIAKKLTVDINNDGKTDVFGFGFEKNSLFWLPFLWSNGGGIIDKNNKVIIDDSASVSALQFYSDLRNKYHVSPKSDEQASLTTSQMFIQGRVAMHMCGRWCSLTYKNNPQLNWDIVNFPYGTKGSVVGLDTSGWAISSSCKHKDVAWKFIEFLASDESISSMTKSGLILPAKKSVANSEVFLNFCKSNSKVFLDIISSSINTPVNKKYVEINDIINTQFEELFNGKLSAKDTITNDFVLKLKKGIHNEAF